MNAGLQWRCQAKGYTASLVQENAESVLVMPSQGMLMGLIVLAQMYHPKADMLQEAKKTGLALATAAAAQRAKRAAARPPPARRTPASAPQVNFRLTTMCLLNRA
jgi:hypothetical protein